MKDTLEPIRVFTDGGSFEEGAICVSVGYAVVDGVAVPLTRTVSRDRDGSMCAEFIAIHESLKELKRLIHSKKISVNNRAIVLVTDNYGCLNAIRSVLAGTYSEKLRNKRNQLHQYLIDDCAKQIKSMHTGVTLLHIRSHIKPRQIIQAYKDFKKTNKVDISYSEFVFLWQQNEKCDNNVHHIYHSYVSQYNLNNRGEYLENRYQH